MAYLDTATEILASKDFINTCVGAFVGAVGAFFLNACYELVWRRNQKHGAMIEAQYTLAKQRDDVEHILEHIEPLREIPNRDQKLKRLAFPFTDLRIPTAKMIFFAQGRPNELSKILDAQASYLHLLGGLQRFCEAKEKFESTARFVSTDMDSSSHLYALRQSDIPLIQAIRLYTDQLYNLADDAVKQLDEAMTLLTVVGKSDFPEKDGFLQYETKRRKPVARKQPLV